jgi:hypothetical protein
LRFLSISLLARRESADVDKLILDLEAPPPVLDAPVPIIFFPLLGLLLDVDTVREGDRLLALAGGTLDDSFFLANLDGFNVASLALLPLLGDFLALVELSTAALALTGLGEDTPTGRADPGGSFSRRDLDCDGIVLLGELFILAFESRVGVPTGVDEIDDDPRDHGACGSSLPKSISSTCWCR